MEELYIVQGNSLYSHNKVINISHVLLSKKDQTWSLNFTPQAKSLQGLLLLFLEDRTNFDNKVESFFNPTIKKSQRNDQWYFTSAP